MKKKNFIIWCVQVYLLRNNYVLNYVSRFSMHQFSYYYGVCQNDSPCIPRLENETNLRVYARIEPGECGKRKPIHEH